MLVAPMLVGPHCTTGQPEQSMRSNWGSPLTGRRLTFPTVKVARGDSGEWFDRTPILVQKDLDGAALERRSVISASSFYKKSTGWAPKKGT